jgi:hypothetical protein
MQKVSRTEDGKPTEITKNISIREQKQEIRMILKEDPFQEFIDVIEAKDPKLLNGKSDNESGVGSENPEAQQEVGPSPGPAESGESNLSR